MSGKLRPGASQVKCEGTGEACVHGGEGCVCVCGGRAGGAGMFQAEGIAEAKGLACHLFPSPSSSLSSLLPSSQGSLCEHRKGLHVHFSLLHPSVGFREAGWISMAHHDLLCDSAQQPVQNRHPVPCTE